MKKFIVFVILLSVFLTTYSNHINIAPLKLVKAYSVKINNSIEPSGLTLWNGEFYTVSDKHNVIYHLLFEENMIELEPFVSIQNDKGVKLDFEGITHDNEFFYLISEIHFQILKISKDGKNQSWLPLNMGLKIKGKEAGLFQVKNAYFEGICLLDDGRFLLAAERQPRGFVEFDASSNDVKAYQKDKAVFNYQDQRSPDFTGLSCTDGVYVLDRNAYTVAKLSKINGEYTEIKGYSYQHIIELPIFKYQDMKYGHAEGLVVDGDDVYIILDNNRNSHHDDTNNNNSLFLKMTK